MIILSEKLNKESLLNLSSLGEEETFFDDIVKASPEVREKIIEVVNQWIKM